MQETIRAVANERLGFKYGKPQRVDEKSLSVVVPILRSTSISRSYVTYPETDKVMVFDTGQIDVMDAENTGEENVFVRSGTLFVGKTQPRALQRSIVLFPHAKEHMNVRCVHQSHGISPQSKTSYGGVTPLAFDQQNYNAGYAAKSQSEYWANAEKTTKMFAAKMGKKIGKGQSASANRRVYTRSASTWYGTGNSLASLKQSMMPADDTEEMMIGFMDAGNVGGLAAEAAGAVGSDNLAKHFDDFSLHFDNLLSKIKCQEDQAGLAVLTEKGVETIEFFDHKHSWKALHDAAVKRIGSNVVGKDAESVFEYKPEHAVKQINRVLGLDWKTNRIYEHRPSNGEPHVLISGISSNEYVGEVVELGDAVIHLVILLKVN